MKIRQLRNATLLLTIADQHLLVDPMLSDPGAMPGFKMFGGGRRRNPLVPLPKEAQACLDETTAVLVTHEHPDHFDKPAVEWVRQRDLTVWAHDVDAPSLRKKGLNVRELDTHALGMSVEVIPTAHGRGPLGWLMGPVCGYFLAHPMEPSIYLTGDSVLTPNVLEALERLRPDVVVAPAGAANFGVGPDILFSVDEVVTLVRHAPYDVVFNHLEAVDHCPTTRQGLRARMDAEGLGDRAHIPKDGEELTFDRRESSHHAQPKDHPRRRPGFQKWLTAKFA